MPVLPAKDAVGWRLPVLAVAQLRAGRPTSVSLFASRAVNGGWLFAVVAPLAISVPGGVQDAGSRLLWGAVLRCVLMCVL